MNRTCQLLIAAMASVVVSGCAAGMNYDLAVVPAFAPRAAGDSAARAPVAPDVKAGWADDNAQYNYYLGYLDQFSGINSLKLDVSGRLVLAVRDADGRSIPNCDLTIRDRAGSVVCHRRTYADGRAMFFPHELPGQLQPALKVEARWGQQTLVQSLDLQGSRNVELRFAARRPAMERVPLDIAFIIDTTGSMGDEIAKLKQTLEAIHYQVTQVTPTPDARFAMVCYRDRGDDYLTKVTPFTGDIQHFARQLQAVSAGGGGDEPEDIQEALRVASTDLAWRPEAIKIAFLLGDAPPHLDYGQNFTYLDFMRQAAGRGIKTTTIGASGLNGQGEYIYRQLAQYTMGLFVFLTYGEKGQTGPDRPTGVSHHTGDNWESRNLDAIIVQSIARELSCLSERPVAVREDYFQACPADGIDNKVVLETLFADCARQLADFSQAKLEPGTPAAVVAAPEEDAGGGKAACPSELAKSLGDQLSLAISRQKCFKLVERDDIKRVLDEVDLGLAFDFGKPATRPARPRVSQTPLPAKLLVLYRLRRCDEQFQMFVKLVSVQTGEILSASMLKIDRKLA